ncbi:glycosyltransferase family 4 protein [Neisseriaceae bacterium B1]
MKIAHVNLARGFRGGERQTLTLIETLSEMYPDITQILVCRHHSPLRQALAHVSNLSFVDAAAQWQGHFSCDEVDIVHAHEARAAHWAWIHSVLFKSPYIITRRVDFYLKDKWLTNQTYQSANMLVAVSQAIASKLAHFAPETRTIYDTFSNLKENQSVIDNLREKFAQKFVIGHVGALIDSHKGQADLIEVARRFEQKYPDCAFVFLGDGADKERFINQSKDLANVHWLGFQDDVGSYLAVMDIFAFPSRTEGLGSTLLDAMAYDVPIVASRVGGIPEIVEDSKTGLLFEVNNVDDLAEKITALYQQPQLRARLTQSAKERLQQSSPQYIAKEYMEIYQTVKN